MARIYTGSALGLLCKSLPNSIVTGTSQGPKDYFQKVWHKLNLFYRTKHGIKVRQLKNDCQTKYLEVFKSMRCTNPNNLDHSSTSFRETTHDLSSVSQVKCKLVSGYIGVIPGKPQLWQIVAEFNSLGNSDGLQHRDLVVFEASDKNIGSWKIVKFM